MPWVRGHYARSPRTTRRTRSETRLALIILAVVVLVALLFTVAHH